MPLGGSSMSQVGKKDHYTPHLTVWASVWCSGNICEEISHFLSLNWNMLGWEENVTPPHMWSCVWSIVSAFIFLCILYMLYRTSHPPLLYTDPMS